MTEAHPISLHLETVDDITIVTFLDPNIITEEEIQGVAQQLYSLVKDYGRRRLILNFAEVRRFSSVMLGVLMTIRKRVAVINGDLKLCGVRPDLLEIFTATGLDRVLTIYKDENEALSAF